MNTHLIITLLVQLTWFSTDLETLQLRGDTYYEINSEKPFSGSIYEEYSSGETIIKGNLKNGKKDGVWTEWYKDGQKSFDGTFKIGEKNGLFTEWYQNGQKKGEKTYKDDELDGLQIQWYQNGQKEDETTYKNGKKVAVWTNWYENGQKEDERAYLKWTWWYENGQKKYEKTYKDDELDTWYEKRQKEYEKTYNDDKDGTKYSIDEFADRLRRFYPDLMDDNPSSVSLVKDYFSAFPDSKDLDQIDFNFKYRKAVELIGRWNEDGSVRIEPFSWE
jgi:antitoxin component YwqK of YwqJK toxin-antitoxin module